LSLRAEDKLPACQISVRVFQESALLRKVIVNSSLNDLYHRCADDLVEVGARSVSRSGQFTLVLSGGSTPFGLYELLAKSPYRERVSWDRVHLFWGDERCVAPDDPGSNFRLAREQLIAPLGIPQTNLHRIKGELRVPEETAREYESDLTGFFNLQVGELPRFDLILLGLGTDGHTASLFPCDSSLQEQDRLVIATQSAHAGTQRVSLTLPTIKHARHIFFLISGAEKSEAVLAVLETSGEGVPLPASLVEPINGDLRFYLDQPAASRLSDHKRE
jgi:6-phosphogluconolactonase